MQKVMDEYAGGIASNYQFNEKQLALQMKKSSSFRLLPKNSGRRYA